MTSIVLYPRGFLGFDIGLESRSKGSDATTILNNIKLNKQSFVKPRSFVSNAHVEDLWKQFKNGDKFLSSFAFRKKILVVALKAFGTRSFYEWCLLQDSNPHITDMQKRFINDTLNYINTGKRTVIIQSWLRLVSSPDTAINGSDSVELKLGEYFQHNEPLHYRQCDSVATILKKWLSNKNGFEDLIGTLHVLFGDKDIY